MTFPLLRICAFLLGVGLPAIVRAEPSAHPHLLVTKERVQKILGQSATDPVMQALLAANRKSADEFLDLPPVENIDDAQKFLIQARAAKGRIVTCAFQYLLTGDPRYAAAAKREMLNVCDFPSWLPQHFLGTAEMGMGVALGYDWIYDALSPGERSRIEDALKRHVLRYAAASYSRDAGTRGIWAAFTDSPTAINNWNFVCNGGYLAVARAIREIDPDAAQTVIDGSLQSILRGLEGYKPDGGWPEGPTYWAYGTEYLTLFLALAENLPEFQRAGIVDPALLKSTLDYRLQAFGPTGTAFNYADGGLASTYATGIACSEWLSQRFGSAFQQTLARRWAEKSLSHPESAYTRSLPAGARGGNHAAKAIFLPPPSEPGASLVEVPPDAHFRGDADLAFFRSSWDDPNALWLAFKAGRNGVPHGHLDLGSFVLEADGVRWALDMGSEDYKLPGYWNMGPGGQRWAYFRMNNLSHNTLSPDETLQDPQAAAPIVKFETSPARAFAIADLTAVYPGKAKRILRGVAMQDRNRILVQDDLTAPADGVTWNWKMFTAADIEIAADKKSANLWQEGKRLRVQVLSPADATLSAADATPPTAREKQNQGIHALVAHAQPEGGDDLRLAILLTPGGPSPDEKPAPDLIPLDSWRSELSAR